jgi:hypothetical protein
VSPATEVANLLLKSLPVAEVIVSDSGEPILRFSSCQYGLRSAVGGIGFDVGTDPDRSLPSAGTPSVTFCGCSGKR